MPYCRTCNKEVTDDLTSLFPNSTNYHVQAGHIVLIKKPHLQFDIAKFLNHFLVEPVIWAISGYGILLGIFASYTWGFFTLHEYSLSGLGFFLSPTQIQTYDLWYDAYPYSLLIFGSYLLALYIKFENPFDKRLHMQPTTKKGFLALPVFIITYATWDFLGIGSHIINGFSIIWLGISAIGLIYYFPIRNQFSIQISFVGLVLFFGIGILFLPSIFLTKFPFSQIIFNGSTIGQYFQGIANESTFCLLCLLSIDLKQK